MKSADTYPTLFFETLRDWELWLEEHHADTAGLWLKIAKGSAGVRSVTYAEALEGALCFGWIDGQKAAYDERYWLQKFTPRRAKSVWSKVNREKVATLIASGRMREAGLRQMEVAQADGRWDEAYDSQRTVAVPPDLQVELDARPEAQAFFQTLNSANRYAILYRIQTAKKPETRAARIKKFVEMLAQGQTIHP